MDKELEEKVKGALANCPMIRGSHHLQEVEGLSYQEMAKAMGCSMER